MAIEPTNYPLVTNPQPFRRSDHLRSPWPNMVALREQCRTTIVVQRRVDPRR